MKHGAPKSIWYLSNQARHKDFGLSDWNQLPVSVDEKMSWLMKIILILLVAFLQIGFFYLAFKLYATIPYNEYIKVETPLDYRIPYLPWSWIIYYFGFAYAVFWGSAGIWPLPRRVILRTIVVYSGLVTTGAALHVAIPTRAPWPLIHNLTAVQTNFKSAFNVEPLSCFPSMHVAMAVLPAFISLYVFKSRVHRLISLALALMVCASVVTTKEHWLLDALTGLLLGLLAFCLWKKYALQVDAFPAKSTAP